MVDPLSPRPGLAIAFAWAVAAPCLAALIPPECVLIYNANSPASSELARYYAERRNVPPDHLLGIRMPIRESIARAEYVDNIAPAVRKFVRDQVWGPTVKCLVTFYDVPLRIEDVKPTRAELERAAQIEKSFGDVCDRIERSLRRGLDGAERAAASAPSGPPREAPGYLAALYAGYAAQRDALQQRGHAAPAEEAARCQWLLVQAVQQMEGEAALLDGVRPTTGSQDAQRDAAVGALHTRVADAIRRIREIRSLGVAAPERAAALPLIERTHGLFGLARQLDRDMRGLRGEETAAALDSELALVLQGEYEAYRWLPNATRRNAARDDGAEAQPPLMVARLDAPSATIVRRMIDDALAAEQRGLSGTVYLDARGLGTRDSYGVYDEDLRRLAALIREKTDLDTVLDDGPALFGPGTCRNAALYCGWYSLADYIDAFEFTRGAVGFHIASFELRTLRQSDKRYWCPELLRHGVAATLGPTDEPYLDSFPRPSEFFGLLLTGELTLAECFQQSNRCLSWRICLLGDPLYRPFAKHPRLKLEDVDALIGNRNSAVGN